MPQQSWVGRVALVIAGVSCLFASTAPGQSPPVAPTILEPQLNVLIDAADVHMETAPFSDPDAGDTHVCTDWQIIRLDLNEIVWFANCLSGASGVHVHLGDGTFVNSLGDARQLLPEVDYRFRVRHRSSGAPEWSAWSERDFTTGSASQVLPMSIEDVTEFPPPRLTLPNGTPFTLPYLGEPSAQIRLVAGCCGASMLDLSAGISGNRLTNPPALTMHMPVKVLIEARSALLNLPALDLQFRDTEGRQRTIYLPPVSNLQAFNVVTLWVSTNGSTFQFQPGDTEPNFTVLARANEAPWETAPDFKASRFATGLQLPVHMVFKPNPGPLPTDPFLYVTELYGDIKVVLRNGTVQTFATGLINFNPTGNFPGSGEIGLAGIDIDTNGDIYASVLYTRSGNPNVGPLHPKLIKLTSVDGGRTANAVTTVLDLFPFEQGPSHQISNVQLMPDDTIIVHMGDGFDITAGQNLNTALGKIMRVRKDGTAPTDNPFYNAANGINHIDYVYALGFRNAFGGGLRRSDNTYYFVENGPGTDRLAKLVSGRNYLFDGTDESMQNFAAYTWFPATAPVDIAFVEQNIFANSGFPAEYAGRAYITQSGGTWASGPGSILEKVVTEFTLAADGTRIAGPRPIAIYNGFGKSSASAIAAGPDGIYFADLYAEAAFDNPTARGSSIIKLSYVAPEDCNANGISDPIEIASGALVDCNGNTIPDVCEVQTGLSSDCDANGVPDECQTTVAEVSDFNTGAGTWSLNGSILTGGAVRLAAFGADGEGSLVRQPFTTRPADRFRVSFDFRITGTQSRGIGLFAVDASRYPASYPWDENGPVFGGTLGVKFDNDGGGWYAAIIRDLNVVTTTPLPPEVGDLGDNVWRRAEVVYGPAGMTVKITVNPGQPSAATHRIFANEAVNFTPYVARIGIGARANTLNTAVHLVDNASIHVFGPNDPDNDYLPLSCECNDIDFNNNNVYPEDSDVIDFFRVLAGDSCNECDSIDFNNDGVFPSDTDIVSFFNVLAGGPCI